MMETPPLTTHRVTAQMELWRPWHSATGKCTPTRVTSEGIGSREARGEGNFLQGAMSGGSNNTNDGGIENDAMMNRLDEAGGAAVEIRRPVYDFQDMWRALLQEEMNSVVTKPPMPGRDARCTYEDELKKIQKKSNKKRKLKKDRLVVPSEPVVTSLATPVKAGTFVCTFYPNAIGSMFPPPSITTMGLPLFRTQSFIINEYPPLLPPPPLNMRTESNLNDLHMFSPPMNPYPTPSPSPSYSSSLSSPPLSTGMRSQLLKHVIRNCSVSLYKLTPEDINRYLKPQSPKSLSSVPACVEGKQLHLLLKTTKKRGRPRKNHGQCSNTTPPVKLKISRVSNEPNDFVSSPVTCYKSKEKNKFQHARGSGLFHDNMQNAKLKKRKLNITPGQDPSMFFSNNLAHSSCHFSCRSTVSELSKGRPSPFLNVISSPPRFDPQPDKESEQSQTLKVVSSLSNLVVPSTPASSSNDDLSASFCESVRNENMNENTDGSNVNMDDLDWISDLFSSELATEVAKEALVDSFLPDISFIEDFPADVIGDLEDFFPSLKSESCETRSPSQHSNTVSPVTQENAMNNVPEILNDEPSLFIKDEESLKSSDAMHLLNYYEDLYRNDILLINAEDESVPLPL